jgi:hypothetical protein
MCTPNAPSRQALLRASSKQLFLLRRETDRIGAEVVPPSALFKVGRRFSCEEG